MDQERIWSHFQNEGADSFSQSRGRLRHLARMLPAGARVLNVGVGGGQFEQEGAERGLEVWTIDPDPAAIETLRARSGAGDRATSGRCEDLPYEDAHFDAVVASEVFEHLDDATLRASIGEIRRVLRPGGRLVGTTPFEEVLADQEVACPCCGTVFHRWGHVQSFTAERMREVLTGGGLEVERCGPHVFVSWDALNWKGRVTAGIKVAAGRLGSHGSSANLLFAARAR